MEKGTPGFTFGKHEDKMGIRASSTTELVFQDCRIPKANLLSREGMGAIVTINTLNYSRPGVGAQALGIAAGALEEAVKYSRERVQFGTAHLVVPGDPAHARRHGDPGGGGARPDVRHRKDH